MKRRFAGVARAALMAASAAFLPLEGAALNACDLNADGAVNAADVNLAIGMSTGAIAPCTASVIGASVCNVVMVQRVINAAQGASCGRTARLTWTASASQGVTGYKVYRSLTNGGSYTLLTATAVTGTSYVDASVQPGLTYYYVVTSVGAGSAESAYSSQVTAVVPSP
jgi:hypothetical protein